jgi:hypothetical protein
MIRFFLPEGVSSIPDAEYVLVLSANEKYLVLFRKDEEVCRFPVDDYAILPVARNTVKEA